LPKSSASSCAHDGLRFGIAVSQNGGQAGQDLDMVRIAPQRRRPRLEISVIGLARGEIGGDGERAIGNRGAQVAALRAVSGLEDHRLSLRRAAERERPATEKKSPL
jgi:hypothetical protein